MKNSNIEWTTHTFNPWIGCTKVSDGCKNCYAEALDRRWGHKRWGPSAARVRTSAANWKNPLKWDREAKAAGERHRVFCASLADVFDDHPSIQNDWRIDLLKLIEMTPNLDWLLLTKRPEKIEATIAETWGRSFLIHPLDNVWLGTTVENQEQAEKRIPALLSVPAKVRFLSCEPLLGPVDLSTWLEAIDHCNQCGAENKLQVGDRCPQCGGQDTLIATWGLEQAERYRTGDRYADGGPAPAEDGPQLTWVIVGGESGRGARPFDLAWARSIRDQSATAGVPVFVKQFGAQAINSGFDPAQAVLTKDRKGGDWSEWPADLRVRQFPEVR
jgi:protein gp37